MCWGTFLKQNKNHSDIDWPLLIYYYFVVIESIEQVTGIVNFDHHLDNFAIAKYAVLVREIRSSPLGTKFYDVCVRKVYEWQTKNIKIDHKLISIVHKQ